MKLLLAVSGGIDSMYMAERALRGALSDFAIEPGAAQQAEFAVAHCNFRLRGEESDGDEQFVREWCSSRGVPLFVKVFDTAEYAAAHGISIEMAAPGLGGPCCSA